MPFHINPQTGEPGRCKAMVNCPFGDLQQDHYATAEDARRAYETAQSSFSSQTVKAYPATIELPSEVYPLLDDLSSVEGVQPLVVGGTIRDSLATNAIPKDVDIEVHGVESMDQLLTILQEHNYRVDEVGKSFGVLKTVLPGGLDIDISLPRRDNLVGEGHTGFEVEVDPTLTLTDAAARRDFTINALYYDHRRGEILDAHGGMEDWEAKRLRHVSDAFSEDPLRVLRAMQFASRFGLTLDPATAAEARHIKDQFPHISTERVQEEWRKLFTKGKSVRHGLTALRETGWDEHFGLDRVDLEDTIARTDKTLAMAEKHGLPKEHYGPAALALTLPRQDRNKFLKSSVVGSKEANKLDRLSTATPPSDLSRKEVKRWARSLAKESSSSVKEWTVLHSVDHDDATIKRLTRVAQETNSFQAPNADLVTGQAIMDATGEKKGGPWIGRLMREAAQAQDDEVFSDEAGAAAWLQERLTRTWK